MADIPKKFQLSGIRYRSHHVVYSTVAPLQHQLYFRLAYTALRACTTVRGIKLAQ
jgi:hypothetical protein